MRRVALILAMAVMLGSGVVLGSLLTPTARADNSTISPVVPGTGIPGYSTTGPNYVNPMSTLYDPPRLQVITAAAPGRGETLTILLDNVTGESYVLVADRFVDSGYNWRRISRL